MSPPPPESHVVAEPPPHLGAVPADSGGGATPTVEEVFAWKRVKKFPWGGSIRTDGTRRVWVGFEMEPAPVELVWATTPERKCTNCNTFTPWRTPKGRPTHPTCEPRYGWLPSAVHAQTTYEVARALGAAETWKE